MLIEVIDFYVFFYSNQVGQYQCCQIWGKFDNSGKFEPRFDIYAPFNTYSVKGHIIRSKTNL